MTHDRRSPRAWTRDALGALLDFGQVVSTTLSSSVSNVLATIRGNEGDAGDEERESALWGHAAILFRPPAGTEVLFLRSGDELVPVASHETRWQVEIAEGEVAIRNLNGDTPARVRLLASGEVLVEGGKLAVVAPGDALAVATKALALAEEVDARLGDLQVAHDTHKHPTAATGPASLPDVFANGAAGVPFDSVASARVFTKD